MKQNSRVFIAAFIFSCSIHILVAAGVYYMISVKQKYVNLSNNEPIKMSILSFKQISKQEVNLPKKEFEKINKTESKPKQTNKPKPKIAEELKPAIVTEQALEKKSEDVENNNIITEILDTNSSETELNEKFASSSLHTKEDTIIAEIIAAINRHKGYPKKAKNMNIEGVVDIEFTVNTNGNIVSSRVVKSSGYKILDTNTIKSLKQASKDFPKPEESKTIRVPIIYQIEQL